MDTSIKFLKFLKDANLAKLNESVRNNPNYVKKPLFPPSTYALHQAIQIMPEEKAVEIIALFIKHGADPNVVNPKSQTPLNMAINLQKYDIIKHLLGEGASPNKVEGTEMSPLYCAILKNDIKIVRMLLEHRVNVHEDFPLQYAVRLNVKNGKIITLLLENGSIEDVNKLDKLARTPFETLEEIITAKDKFVDKFGALMTPQVIEHMNWNNFFIRQMFSKMIYNNFMYEACHLAKYVPIETFESYEHILNERGATLTYPSMRGIMRKNLERILIMYNHELSEDKEKDFMDKYIVPNIEFLKIMKARGVDISSLSDHPILLLFPEFDKLFDDFKEARNVEFVSTNSENMLMEPIENGNEIAILDNMRRNQRVVIRKANGTNTQGRMYLRQTKKNPLTSRNITISNINVRTARIQGGKRLRHKRTFKYARMFRKRV